MKKDLSVPLLVLARRRMNGVRTVSSGAVSQPIPQAEFRDRLQRHRQEALANAASLPKVVEGLWKSEGLSTTFGKLKLPDNTLADARIPCESLGIAHVGYGAASAEYTLFDTEKLGEIFETKCQPQYRGFSEEGTGSTLRIYEPGLFKFMCGMLGLIPRHAPPGPDKSGFFAGYLRAFPPESQRLITHGYGRLVAFSRLSVHKAIAEAMALPPERVEPCVQGIAFAFAMMNAPDMPELLANSKIDYPPPVRAAFQTGLVYALAFDEWFVPGLLAAWRPTGGLEEHLIESARSESALNLKRGYPLCFRLENPITP